MELIAGLAGLGLIFVVIWWILLIIGNWKLFEKAGKPAWHSIIPILNIYDEYDICWNGFLGIVMLVATSASYMVTPTASEETSALMAMIPGICGIVAFVLQVVESYKLAQAFGKGIGYTIFLVLFDRIARIVLGFSDAQYLGKKEQ